MFLSAFHNNSIGFSGIQSYFTTPSVTKVLQIRLFFYILGFFEKVEDEGDKLMFIGELRGRSEPSFGEGSDTSKNFESGHLLSHFRFFSRARRIIRPKAKNPKRMLAFAAASTLWATDKPSVYPLKMTRSSAKPMLQKFLRSFFQKATLS